jgi:hypothetical protein
MGVATGQRGCPLDEVPGQLGGSCALAVRVWLLRGTYLAFVVAL